LNTVKKNARHEIENGLFSIARIEPAKTLSSLSSIDNQFPKLNVAGSIPVSRSIEQ